MKTAVLKDRDNGALQRCLQGCLLPLVWALMSLLVVVKNPDDGMGNSDVSVIPSDEESEDDV